MQPIYQETKQFKNYADAALHLKGVYDRTKLENRPQAKIKCEFHGKFVAQVKVYFNHNYAQEITPLEVTILKQLALLSDSKGIGIPTGDKKTEVYEIKLVTSSLSENDLEEFKQALSVHDLFVGVSTLKTPSRKSESDSRLNQRYQSKSHPSRNFEREEINSNRKTEPVVPTQTRRDQEQDKSLDPEAFNFSRVISGVLISEGKDGKNRKFLETYNQRNQREIHASRDFERKEINSNRKTEPVVPTQTRRNQEQDKSSDSEALNFSRVISGVFSVGKDGKNRKFHETHNF